MYETTKNNQGNQLDQNNQGSDNLPRVRFPEFNDEWEHKRLSELLSESKKRNGDLKYDKDSLASSPIVVLHSSEQFPSDSLGRPFYPLHIFKHAGKFSGIPKLKARLGFTRLKDCGINGILNSLNFGTDY